MREDLVDEILALSVAANDDPRWDVQPLSQQLLCRTAAIEPSEGESVFDSEGADDADEG